MPLASARSWGAWRERAARLGRGNYLPETIWENIMRTIVNSSQVAHLWANQSQPEASNGGRSFYFDGPTIYSYGRHFPIASHVKNRAGASGVIFTRQRHSVTTAKHVTQTWRALRGLDLPVFSVPSVSPGATLAEELPKLARLEAEAYRASLPARLLRIRRARSQWAKDYEKERLSTDAEAVNTFAKFAGYRGRVFPPADLEAATVAALGAARRETERQRKARAKAEAERRIWEAGAAERLQADVVKWEAEAVEWATGARASLRYYPGEGDGKTLLRLSGETIQTSRGAEIPAHEGRRILELILRVRESGQGWEASGLELRFGGFPLRSISSGGDLSIGCHLLKWAEIERFADSAGWLSPVAVAA